MAKNGSPPPRFSTDAGRTYFLAELLVHQELPGVKAHDEVHDEVHDVALNETEEQLLTALISGPQSRPELAKSIGIKSTRTGHLSRAMERLRNLKLAELTIPDKPQSKNQKMRITKTGRAWIAAHGDEMKKSTRKRRPQ